MPKKLKNLHECLQDASYEEMLFDSCADYQHESKARRTRPFVVQSFQIDLELKTEIDLICRSNGATASSFLRECCRKLVSEYTGEESTLWPL